MRGKTNSVTTSGGSTESSLKKLLDATKSACYLFYLYNGSSIEGLISYDDTENVVNFNQMFSECINITSIPLFNTSNGTDISYIFNACSNLTSVPLFDTGNVTTMNYVFSGCKKLTNIPFFNTSKVTNMNSMFYYCSKITTIPLFNTSNVTNMDYMFSRCKNLTEIPALNTSNVTSFSGTFGYCSSLTAIHMTGMKSSFNISASTLFTTEALHEIIDNLATVTSSRTLTMGSTNLAKVSEEYKAIATNKGWTLA